VQGPAPPCAAPSLPVPGRGAALRAALGFLPHQESARSRAWGCSACSCPSVAFLPPCKVSQYTARGLSGVKADALRCVPGGLRPSLDTRPPPWLRGERREESKTAEGQPLRRPSNPVARVYLPVTGEEAQGNLDTPSQSHTSKGKPDKATTF
jgi:hypothetical protein